MLQNGNLLYINAQENNYAIPQFNINNLEWTKYILEECQLNHSPVILGVTESAIKYMGGYDVIVFLIKSLIKDLKITIPVVIHLDHGTTIESCLMAIDAGFTSVMLDASKYDIKTNCSMVKKLVDLAKIKSVVVEAEVGQVGGLEDGVANELKFASVEECILMSKTGITTLAPALGSVHGIYSGKPNLNFIQMTKIKNATKVPLVLHGGSGIPDEMIINAIASGIVKINYNTDLQIEWAKSIKTYLIENNQVYDPRRIIGSGEIALKAVVRKNIFLLKSNNRY